MKIWAHRGCSQRYPENTLLAFEKAANLKGLTGIELDIQLSKDGRMVVIHDEKLGRTTEGFGFVRDFTLAELKKLHIYADSNKSEQIPTIEEVLDLLEDHMKNGLLLNIELKNNVFYYTGMERSIVELIQRRGLEKQVIYSSFYTKSLEMIHALAPQAELGVLDIRVSDCMYKAKGCCKGALHPFWKQMDLDKQTLEGYTVRAWLSGHLFPEKPTGTILDLKKLEEKGITDVMLNEPEVYL